MSKPKFETLYPPRGMRAERAAAYLSISTSLFYKMVEDERMPPPVKVGAASIWDRVELDAAFDNLKDRPKWQIEPETNPARTEETGWQRQEWRIVDALAGARGQRVASSWITMHNYAQTVGKVAWEVVEIIASGFANR